MSAATMLLIIMWIFAAVFFIILAKDVIAHKNELDNEPDLHNIHFGNDLSADDRTDNSRPDHKD